MWQQPFALLQHQVHFVPMACLPVFQPWCEHGRPGFQNVHTTHFLFGISITNLDSFQLAQKFDVRLGVPLEGAIIQRAFSTQQLASLLFNFLKHKTVFFLFSCIFFASSNCFMSSHIFERTHPSSNVDLSWQRTSDQQPGHS